MSHYDRTMETLCCKGCGETHLMRTALIFNPERYVMAVERFSQEHKDCEKFKNMMKAKAVLMLRRLTALMDAPAASRGRLGRRARA